MEGVCLFCNQSETSQYVPLKDTDFICSSCVLFLSDADQEDLKRAHAKAIKKGYSGKASALESFIIEDEINVRKTKKFKRDLVRERPLQSARSSCNEIRA